MNQTKIGGHWSSARVRLGGACRRRCLYAYLSRIRGDSDSGYREMNEYVDVRLARLSPNVYRTRIRELFLFVYRK